MNSIKEDSNHFNGGVKESSQQQDGEESAFQLNELFEAKNYQTEDEVKAGQSSYKLNTIKKTFNKQIKSYILSINEGQMNTKQLKVQLQINNLKAQTLVFQVFVHKISLDITAVSSKDQILRLKIYPGARFELNSSIIQQVGAQSSVLGTSLADKGQIQINRKHKSEENTQLANNQTQQSFAEEQMPINGNSNGTVAFKQILSQQYSQDSKFLQSNEECYLAQNSQDKSLLIPSILGGQSINNQNQQQLIQKQQGTSNNLTQNNTSYQNNSNSVYVFNAPSDFLLKDKWINLIVDLKSFFKDVNEDFVVKNIEIGSQCRLKSIFYSKQSDLRASLISKHDLIVNSGTNKFIPQMINFQQVSQMIDDSSPKHGQRKSQSNNINFLLPQSQAIQANSQTTDINTSKVDTSVMIHNSIALPAKTPNKSNKYQNRYSVHLSNYKHSQVALQQAQNTQAGSSKSYSKQPPPPLIQQQQSPTYHNQVHGISSTSASNTSTNPGSAQLSKLIKRRESKNGYSGNISINNQSFQQQLLPNSQSLQYNQNSYLSNNISFEQPHQQVGHSHLNSQNILFYQSTSQSTHPNCVLNSDEESTKCLYSGPNTQRTSSVYFYNAKRSSRSNVSGIQQQPSYHANSHHHYQQNSYLNNSVAAGSGNNISINPNSGQLNNNNNSIRLPKIISLLKQRSSSIYSGVTNRSHQIVEELDIAPVQNISNINSTRRAKDQSRNYQAGKSPNNSVSNNNINQGVQNNQANPNKLTLNNIKIQSGIEQLLTQNVSNSPSKSNINTSRTHQKHYKSSQQRFVTVSINQSPKNKNQTQNTIPNFDLLPNNTSIHYPNSNDLYNIADQSAQNNNEEDFKIQKRIRSEDDNDDINMSIKPENSKLSVMSKLSTVLFKNSTVNASNQNKENDPRCRNTPAQKKEKYVNLNNKRRSSLFCGEQNKPAQLQQNCQTINSINTINAKASIQTSRRQNSNSNQHQQQISNQQQTPQQCLQYLTQQSSIQNDEDQPNIDYSQYAYYAPKNKNTKFQSQSPAQIMTHRSGNMSVKKSYGNYQSNNKNCQMQILNSPQQQQSPLSNQKSYIRNSYSIINKRQSAAAVNYKQNSLQINQSNNNSEELQMNNDTSTVLQNDKSERKKKIVMQQQYLQNKDSFCHEIQQNSSHSQPLQKVGGGTSRANYHHSPPPLPLKNHRDTSQEATSSHIQQTKSKISLIPSHILQYSLQTQIAQTNPSNTLQISINQGYQPQQSLSQAKTTKKQLHHQQFTGPTPSKSNSRNQSPLVNKIANSGKTSNQQITNSNSISNGVNIKIEGKNNSLERNPLAKKPSTTNNNQLAQNINSPNLKRNIQKSGFSNENKQNRSASNEKKSSQNINQSSDKKNKAQMGLDFSKLPLAVHQKQDILLKNAAANIIFKTEEVQDDEDQNNHAQKKLAQRKISEGQESPSKGKEKSDHIKKNLLQAFNQAEDNTDRINIQSQQISTQNEEFEDEQKVLEQNEIYQKNVHRFSSTYNNPELSLPLTLLQKNLQQAGANQTGTSQQNETNKTLFQNGILKSQPIALTASNLLNINDQQQDLHPLNQDIEQKQNKKLDNNSNLKKDKQYKRKYQQNQFQKKKSKSNSDTAIKAQEYEELAEEIIESQQSECLLTNPINTNQDDVIEEKIETKSISITNQSKSIMSDIDKKNEIMLKTSGSVYESQHMTSSEEECNESGLAISIQVDNIDIKEDLDMQKIPPQYKKQKSSAKKKEKDTASPTERIKKKQESGNKFIQEIEKQIPSCNSIEVSKVLIVQDDDEDEYDKQLINQINSLPYTSDWRIQSFLIENKTDILKNRINLSNLINGVAASSKTQPVETIINNQELNQNLQNKLENKNIKEQQINYHQSSRDQNKLVPKEKKQNNHSKIFGNPQILQLNDVIQASE
ncbi:hypothetical protein ABPG74_018790 [Tetrahymena malaccensis]